MIRYYPGSKVITNQNTAGTEFLDTNGIPYTGKYYITYDGSSYTGISPQTGPSEPLKKIITYPSSKLLSSLPISETQKRDFAIKTNVGTGVNSGAPVSFYPQPTEQDYKRGYLIRYFTKKVNEKGFVTEISQREYQSITDGTANYDISFYQVVKILWKITGPLRSERQSQYNIIPGIIDTNQRLTEAANKTFLGIVDYIGGDYTKYARPTA